MIAIAPIADVKLLWQHSPLLRGAVRTLGYMLDNGPIGLTPAGALQRKFVEWAAEVFAWPGYSPAELYALHKVLNEADFPPLVVLHDLLVATKLARHHKGCLTITKYGRTIAAAPEQLWELLTSQLLWFTDHGRYMRQRYGFVADWTEILDIINETVHHGADEARIYAALLDLSREDARRDAVSCQVLNMFVLRPLSWAGLLTEVSVGADRSLERIFVKSPLWPLAWQLPSDDLLPRVQVH